MATAVTFGEALLRLSPPGGRRLEQAAMLEAWPAGAELNVAVGLARLGTPAAWVSRLPESSLGRTIDRHARANGVETDQVVWAEDARLGLYFLEVSEPPRSSSVLYDRADSAFARLDPGEFDWPALLEGAEAFHTSGITPALSEACAQATAEAFAAARAAGCHTSYDVNLRRRLTTADEAGRQLERIAAFLDVVVCAAEDVAELFAAGEETDPVALAELVRDALGVPLVVVSGWSPAGTRLRCAHGDATETIETPRYRAVDPIGSGDAFCAGLLHGVLTGETLRQSLALGDAAATIKLSIPGDAPLFERGEVLALAAGTEAGLAR